MFTGEPIEVRYASDLSDSHGNPAHAATYIRQRVIVLDSELKRCPREHRRILTHELFHFVWVRMGNPKRRSWEHLLASEGRARGEAGWSAEWRRQGLSVRDRLTRTTRWREYCCESFCDTAAWLATGDEAENTLARKHCAARRIWFHKLNTGPLPI